MSSSLIEAVMSRLSPDVVGKVAGAVGESPAKTGSAISSAVPSLFAGLIQKGSTEAGASNILSGLKDMQASQTFGDITEPKGSMARGGRMMSGMLGDSGNKITDLIAQGSGIRRESSSGILSFVFPIIAGVIGKQVASRGLGASGLMDLLSSQKSAVLSNPNMPKGLGSLLGLGGVAAGASGIASGVGDVVQKGSHTVTDRFERVTTHADVSEPHVSVANTRLPERGVIHAPVRKSRTPWGAILGALAIGALLLGGLMYFTRGSRHAAAPVQEAPVAVAPEEPAAPLPEAPKPTVIEEQISETTLTSADLPKSELDSHFTGNGALPERFTLPNVNFEFATTQLVAGGESSVDELASALKAHPSARIRLEGFTDSVGDDGTNSPLSQRRADVVKQMLVAKGIDAGRIETAGRSATAPVADNDSDEGRLKNRRTDAVILSR